MAKGICVFDLDNTLGDFRAVDFFGLLLEPKILPNYYGFNKMKSFAYSEIISSYTKEEKDLLLKLRNQLELLIDKEGFNKKILRPDIQTILSPLVEEFKKHKIKGFIIYSNNSNLYVLEYAGRAIERLFDTEKLFIKYLDRNHEERTHDIPDQSGYPSKMVKTVIKYSSPKAPILFVDDLVHNDFFTDLDDTTYILIPAYVAKVEDLELQIIISLFEELFDELREEEQKLFFNMYHIKETLKINKFETLEKFYLQYSKEKGKPKPFNENLPMIQDKINTYIKKLSFVGGKRKTRKNSRKSIKSKRSKLLKLFDKL
jgi:hypothetical protein